MKNNLLAFAGGGLLAVPFLVLKHYVPASFFLVLTACEFGVLTFGVLRIRAKLK